MNSKCSHFASFAASIKAIYSVLIDNKATVGCFLEHQIIGPLFNIKMKPKVDFQLSSFPAQLQLEYPLTNSFFCPL